MFSACNAVSLGIILWWCGAAEMEAVAMLGEVFGYSAMGG